MVLGQGQLPREFVYDVSLGLIPGWVHTSKVGVNAAIPNATFILLSNITSAAFPINFPATPRQMQVVSSSANDTGAGTGAQQVQITYLRSPTSVFGFTENTETITLNGLGAVNTVNTDIFRIQEFKASRVGTGLFAAGNIALQDVGGAVTWEQIDAGTNRFRTCIHFVPKGMRTIITEATKGCSTAGGTIFIIEQTMEDSNQNVVTMGIEQVELANFAFVNPMTSSHVIENPNGLIKFFAMVVKGRAANQSGSGTMHLMTGPL